MAILVSDVTLRARVRLSDITGETFDDETLVPFVVAAYEEAARVLRAKGMNLFRRESSAISVPSGTKTIVRSGGSPVFPSDLLRPLEIRWRAAGAGTWVTVPLKLNDGFFQDATPTASLSLYDFRDDTILLGVGASVNTEVQIQYEAELPALVDPSSTVKIPNSIDPLALLTASYAADSRDEMEHSVRWDTLAHAQLDLIAASEQNARAAIAARWQGQ